MKYILAVLLYYFLILRCYARVSKGKRVSILKNISPEEIIDLLDQNLTIKKVKSPCKKGFTRITKENDVNLDLEKTEYNLTIPPLYNPPLKKNSFDHDLIVNTHINNINGLLSKETKGKRVQDDRYSRTEIELKGKVLQIETKLKTKEIDSIIPKDNGIVLINKREIV